MDGSELVLEVAEARLWDVTVEGSLLVHADNVMGHREEQQQQPVSTATSAFAPSSLSSSNGNGKGVSSSSSNGGAGGFSSWAAAARSSSSNSGRLSYSCHNGRVHMMNVAVQNVGIDWHHPGNVYWQHRVQRHESCRIILRGRSEFEAYDCKIRGNQVGWFVLGGWVVVC